MKQRPKRRSEQKEREGHIYRMASGVIGSKKKTASVLHAVREHL